MELGHRHQRKGLLAFSEEISEFPGKVLGGNAWVDMEVGIPTVKGGVDFFEGVEPVDFWFQRI